jgi:hypothetical protein
MEEGGRGKKLKREGRGKKKNERNKKDEEEQQKSDDRHFMSPSKSRFSFFAFFGFHSLWVETEIVHHDGREPLRS